jgi:DNA-binding transcriptional LysR family regulator
MLTAARPISAKPRPSTPNMRFSLRQLEYFVAACDAGSITVAAREIPVSQSSVSAAISQLEVSLGVQLLIRHHAQGVSTTPAGRRFLDRARALTLEADRLERFAGELSDALSGPLEIGCFVPVATMVAPRLCQEFQSHHPGVNVRFVEAFQHEILAHLRSGALSLALTYDMGLEDDIAFEPIATLPAHAVFPDGHPHVARESISIAEVAREPFIMLDMPLSRDYMSSLFIAEGVQPNVVHRSAYPEVIRGLVANHYGTTIINARPQHNISLDGQVLHTIRLTGSSPPRPMILGIARLRASVASAFLDHCRDRVTAETVPGLRTAP